MFVKGQKVVCVRKPDSSWWRNPMEVFTIPVGAILTVHNISQSMACIALVEYNQRIQAYYSKRNGRHYDLDDCNWWLPANAFEPFPE